MNFIFSIQKLAALCLMIMVCSCSGSQNKNTNHNNGGEIPLETYINVNRSLVEREQQKIKEYVADNSLDMQTTGTGLWYRIDHPGKGPDIQKGKVVVLDYQIKLLDGTVCYDSDEQGPKEFLVGRGGVESGLEEGILLLNEGGRAQFIMPPHLAHGLIGDDNQIPSRSIILYEIEVVEVKNK